MSIPRNAKCNILNNVLLSGFDIWHIVFGDYSTFKTYTNFQFEKITSVAEILIGSDGES